MRKLCRIQAVDPDGRVAMDLFAELSDKELKRTAAYLEKMVVQGLLRAYRAEYYQEMRQLHLQALLMPALLAELEDLEVLMNRRNRPDMSGRRLGPKEWSPIDDATQHIADQIGRTFFVSAWASGREERGQSFSGQEIFDVAPKTPEYMERMGLEYVRTMERANQMPMRKMYEQALEKANLSDDPDHRDDFGFLTAMQAMGTGVRWTDDYEDHGLKVPYVEVSQYDLKDEDLEDEGNP